MHSAMTDAVVERQAAFCRWRLLHVLLVLVSQTVQKKLDKAEEEWKHAKMQACEASKERDALKACASALVFNILLPSRATRPRYADMP